MANLPRSVKDRMTEAMWPELAAYEKGPQNKVSDKVNPFKGATPAKAADPAAVAAVAAGNIDATPGGAPASAQTQVLADDDAPVVDEDGSLIGDPTDSGEGTSDDNSADASTAAVDSGDEVDPNADLVSPEGTEEPEAKPAPKKGSAQERIVEVLDLAEGYKVFGQHMQEQLKEAHAELARLRGGGTPAPTAAPATPPVEVDEPMPDMTDEDVQFDNDKYRAKMAKWVKGQTKAAAKAAVAEVTGAETAQRTMQTVETKIAAFAKEHPDFEQKVTKNPVLAANKLALEAGAEVARSEHVAELLYAFGSDPGLAIRVAKQSPAQQLMTIGRMIAKIEAEKETGVDSKKSATPQAGAKPAAKKSITQAPPPPRAVAGAGRPAAKDPLDPSMSIEEFARQHRAGKQNARADNRKQRGLN